MGLSCAQANNWWAGEGEDKTVSCLHLDLQQQSATMAVKLSKARMVKESVWQGLAGLMVYL
jgi:hypothetical protein